MNTSVKKEDLAFPVVMGLADAVIQIGAQGLQWAVPKITDWVIDLFSLEDAANGNSEHHKQISFPGPNGEIMTITLTVGAESLPAELKNAVRNSCEAARCAGAVHTQAESRTFLLDATQLKNETLTSGGVSLLNGIFSVSW